MNVLAEITAHPMDGKSSHSGYIAECIEIFREHNLTTEVHAHGTNVEGELSDVLSALESCHHRLHELGIPRLTSTVKIDSRTDRTQTSRDRLTSVAVAASLKKRSQNP